MDSTAELLFNISANSEDAQANIEKFRALMDDDLADIRANWEEFGASAVEQQAEFAESLRRATEAEEAETEATEGLGAAHAHAVTEIQATSGALRLLEGSGGMRAMERFTATTLGLGPAMKAIFPVVGALAFAEIIVRMGEKVYELVHQWDPLVQAEQRATDTAKALNEVIARTGEEIRKLNAEALEKAIGKPAATINEADQVLRTRIQADRNMIAGLLSQIVDVEARIAKASARPSGVIPLGEKGSIAPDKKDLETLRTQLSAFQMDMEKSTLEMRKLGTEAAEAQIQQNERMTETTKEAKTEFSGLVTIVESMKSKIAEQGTGWDRLAEEVAHYHVEIAKAKAELNKLHSEGKITAESYGQEQSALGRIPGLLATVIAETTRKLAEADTQAWGEAVAKSAEAQEQETYALEQAGERRVEVTREIAEREAGAGEQGYAQQKAALQKQIDDWAAGMAKKTALTIADWAAIDRVTIEGLGKIDQAEATAYQEQLRRLHEHLDATAAANATEAQKLYLDYQKELEQYSQIEEQKTLKTTKGEQQRAQVEQMYATIRAQINQKYQDDLQKLLNSQGFQGVFGNYFGNLIRNNQTLLRQWATSANQSLLMVRVAMQSLKDMSQQTFQGFVQGMGQSIAAAIVGQKSIGQAMEAMLKSTLESFAGQAITAALMATGWGFYWLMLQNYAAAGQAFTSAAIFGSVGAAAAVAGSMMPSSSSSGAGGGSGSRAGAGGSGVAGSPGAAAGNGGRSSQQPNVYVNVEGHVIGPSGAAQLADILNQAIYGNSVTLYATHNPQGVPL